MRLVAVHAGRAGDHGCRAIGTVVAWIAAASLGWIDRVGEDGAAGAVPAGPAGAGGVAQAGCLAVEPVREKV